jgi:hypothetical protein
MDKRARRRGTIIEEADEEDEDEAELLIVKRKP